MVHALREVWRVLTPDGSLIDLRPLVSHPPIAIVAGDAVRVVGYADDTRNQDSDTAVAQALTQVRREGLFERSRHAVFSLHVYWQNPDDMQVYIRESWANGMTLPDEVYERAVEIFRTASPFAQIRASIKLTIARYAKII